MNKYILMWIAALGLVACQPGADDDTVDPETVLEPFEEALAALGAAMTAHADAVASAADDAAIMAEEASFAETAGALIEACAHAAEDLGMCSGMDDDAMGPGDVTAMFEGFEETFAAHHDAMDAAADKAAEEATFQAEGDLHMGHGTDLSDDMHAHADEGELTCMMMGEHSD